MKILSVGNFGVGWDGSICDEEHIASALEELGHEVTRWQRGEVGMFDAPYDFALIAQWDGYGPEFRRMVREMTRIVVYWAFDYQADNQEWHENLLHMADLYLSKRIADSKHITWQWLPQDFAPNFLFETDKLVEKDIDVLFTGSYLDWAIERNKTLKAVDENFNLVIHSVNEWKGFKDVRPPIMDEGLPELYSRAKVILSIDHTLEAGYWSDRNAQIMCCGKRPLFRYVPMSESRFHDMVDYFYSVDDCLEQISKLLSVDNNLDSLSYEYAQKYFKVKSRARGLIRIVNAYLSV